jgi:hypothetical protein
MLILSHAAWWRAVRRVRRPRLVQQHIPDSDGSRGAWSVGASSSLSRRSVARMRRWRNWPLVNMRQASQCGTTCGSMSRPIQKRCRPPGCKMTCHVSNSWSSKRAREPGAADLQNVLLVIARAADEGCSGGNWSASGQGGGVGAIAALRVRRLPAKRISSSSIWV